MDLSISSNLPLVDNLPLSESEESAIDKIMAEKRQKYALQSLQLLEIEKKVQVFLSKTPENIRQLYIDENSEKLPIEPEELTILWKFNRSLASLFFEHAYSSIENLPGGTVSQSFLGLLANKKSAKDNSPVAQYYIGLRYYNGLSVLNNPKKAVDFFRKAADQGLPRTQFRLGDCYGAGIGVKKDVEEAVK